MATIYKEFLVKAAPERVWDVIKDFGAVHTRFARTFVKDTVVSGDVRTVTFANGFVARERLVSVSDEQRRFVYALVEGRTSHHNASFQVFAAPNGQSRILWITDLLPDSARAPIAEMVELGSVAIQRTLEETASAATRSRS